MSLAFLFWFLLLMLVLFDGWWSFRPTGDRLLFGRSLIWFVLLCIIGYALFGKPLH